MSSLRKWFLVLLAIGVSLSVVLASIWVAQGHGTVRPDPNSRKTPHGTPPNVTFAPGVTSGNKDVDAFVDRFLGLCRRGDYDQYRLDWTAYGTPVSGERFTAMWKFARKVVITQIIPVPEHVKAMHPAYVIKASVELDPKAKIATKDVEVMVQWEQNRWAIAPAPRLESPAEPESVTDTGPASQAKGQPVSHS